MKRVKKKKGTGKNAHHYYTKEVRLALCKNILLLQVDLLVQMVRRFGLQTGSVCAPAQNYWSARVHVSSYHFLYVSVCSTKQNFERMMCGLRDFCDSFRVI